jgi:hypothetical protein
MKLFDVPILKVMALDPTKTCRYCEHRQRWDFNGKIFQYCGVRKSGRTSNGLLKIRCKDKACKMFKKEK